MDPHLLPDRIIPIIQLLFQQPPWVMWGGVVLGTVVALVVLRLVWPLRKKIWGSTRSRPWQVVFFGGLFAVAVGGAFAGMKVNTFIQRDNRFCNGCHIFVPAGQHWALPDTGNYTLVNKLEGKHDTLSCHACHELNMKKEAVKFVLWMSGDRGTGERVPPHAKVPRRVCEGCHVQGAAKESWQAIAATAGHRTHLESDSLKSRIECLTCHARSAHRFVPPDSTCSQKGCHLTSEVQIKLGKMAGQTDFHCNACHRFTKQVPLLATRDSAAGSLRPNKTQCLACHPMQLRLATFDPSRDPHNASCGTCHNPHAQVKPVDALKSCTTAGCHDNWRKVAFHSGKAHQRIESQCLVCHDPHAARVDASDCTGCHARAKLNRGGTEVRPPQPFDTLQALKRTSALPRSSLIHGKGDAPPEEDLPAAQLHPAAVADSFSHERHRELQCILCHSVSSKQTTLTFVAPRGCQICHHQAPDKADCLKCHEKDGAYTFRQVRLSIAPAKRPPEPRMATFSHTVHSVVGRCVTCHKDPVTMAPVDSVTRCSGCHVTHHTTAKQCAGCHASSGLTVAHADARGTHSGCNECHAPAVVALLTPNRALCLTCHADKTEHHAERECTTCHLLETPEGWRDHLMRRDAR